MTPAFTIFRQHNVLLIAGAAGLLILAAIGALFSYQVKAPPDDARVIADGENFTYASTPCIIFNTLDRELIKNRPDINDPTKELELMPFANERTMADMRRAGQQWSRDKTCNAAIGYDQIVTAWMRIFGYRSRWDDDGVWRW